MSACYHSCLAPFEQALWSLNTRCPQPSGPRISGGTSPQLLPSPDVSGTEEGNAWKPQVLVQHEDPDRDDVGVTQVVDEAADVAIVTGINAVNLSILAADSALNTHLYSPARRALQRHQSLHPGFCWLAPQLAPEASLWERRTRVLPAHLVVQIEEVRVIFSHVGLGIRDQLSNIPIGHKLWFRIRAGLQAPSLSNLNPCNPLLLLSCHHGKPPGHCWNSGLLRA